MFFLVSNPVLHVIVRFINLDGNKLCIKHIHSIYVNIDADRFSLNQSYYNTRKGAYQHSIQTIVQRFSFKHRIFRKLTN